MITMDDRTFYSEMIEDLKDGIDGILAQDRRVSNEEPILRHAKVIACAPNASYYTMVKLNELYDVIYNHTTGMSRMFVEPTDNGARCYFVAFQGKNGHGDFAQDDLASAIAILQGLRKQYKNATMIDMRHDILDDVSAWSYVFEI